MKTGITFKLFVAAVVVFAIVFTINYSVSGVKETAVNEGQEALKTSIMRAAASCYATEGYYPPTLDYIKDNYGIIIDDSEYAVFYDVFAKNIAPDITVIAIDN
ncbi:MAG: hypothetical protein K6E56_04050 [Lachnospiraceae bacterium]|nr:hypothetical protein [Lachnospiraceae bacterium]